MEMLQSSSGADVSRARTRERPEKRKTLIPEDPTAAPHPAVCVRVQWVEGSLG